MSLNYDGLELTDEQKKKLDEQNSGLITEQELNDKISGLTTKRDELLAEQIRQKQKRTEAEEESEKVRIAGLEKAKNFEELYKSQQNKNDELSQELKAGVAEKQQLRLKDKALIIANELSDGDKVPLLATFVQKRLKFDEGEMSTPWRSIND